jgi:hypothetical protein
MYRAHQLLNTPQDDTKLWRYLDLFHFFWLLSRQSLYFANLVEFSDDKWEGALPAGMEEALRRMYRESTLMEEIDPEMLKIFKRALISLQATYGVNCWHKNKVESVAMWKLYTHGMDGVAIQTTVGRLKACLSPEPRPIYIADVKYGHDEHSEEDPISDNALIPIVTKRRSFEHESEVRLILERELDIYRVVNHEIFGGEEGFPVLSKGETVKVDLTNLIVKIVASPTYPLWAIPSLQEGVAAAGFKVEVEKSDLLRSPETEGFRS